MTPFYISTEILNPLSSLYRHLPFVPILIRLTTLGMAFTPFYFFLICTWLTRACANVICKLYLIFYKKFELLNFKILEALYLI